MDKFVIAHEKGIYRLLSIDYKTGKCTGNLLFPGYGESNPVRVFNIVDCRIEKV